MNLIEKHETAIELLKHIKKYLASQKHWEDHANDTIYTANISNYKHRAKIFSENAERLKLRYNKLMNELMNELIIK